MRWLLRGSHRAELLFGMHLHEAVKGQTGRRLHLHHEDEVRELDVGRDVVAWTKEARQLYIDRPGKRVHARLLVDI